MLGRFPTVRRWADTGDVLQSALVRLLGALKQVDVPSTRAFFGLAAEQMRRELLDLARHFHGPHGYGARHAAPLAAAGAGPTTPPCRQRTWSGGVRSTRRSAGCRRPSARSSG
jgi:hypothetical protein